jgi:hypothetical protein
MKSIMPKTVSTGHRAKAYLQQLAPEVCVYCHGIASSRDHVVARTILARPLPQNLPTVPSCDDCNNRFSKDEQYFAAVLGMVGRTPEIEERVQEGADIYRTLEQSPRLDDRLISSVFYIPELGAPPILQVEERRVESILQKIAFGLFLAKFHPKTIPSLASFKPVPIRNVTSITKLNNTESFRQRRWAKLQKDVFEFVFFTSSLAPYMNSRFCLMRFYGPTWIAAVQCPDVVR